MFGFLNTISSSNSVPKLSGINTVGQIFGIFLNVLMGVGFAIALITIAYSGIQYALSTGDPKHASQAWNTFIWGVIAAAISVGALAIKAAVLGLAGDVPADISNALPNF